MQLQSAEGSPGYSRWTAAGNLGAESAGGVSPRGSPRRSLAVGQRDRSEEQWREGHGRRIEATSGRSAGSQGAEGIARAPLRTVRIDVARQRPAAQRVARTWASPKLIRNAQYEQPVMWRSLEQTSGKAGLPRAYATYDRYPHLIPRRVDC